jgi:TolA-binding protein
MFPRRGGGARIPWLAALAAVLLPVCCLGADDPATAAAAPAQPLAIKVDRVTAGRGGNWAEIGIEVRVGTAGEGIVTVSPHAPAGITIRPASRVIEIGGAGAFHAEFRARSEDGNWRQAGDVSFSAELVANGQNWRDRVTVAWPASLDTGGLFHAPRGWFIALVAGLLALAWYRYRVLASGPRRSRLPDARLLFDLLVLLTIEAFILAQMNPDYLLTSTTTTGGDTASHFYTLEYLKQVLLPAGLVSGWTPGNYAGFPILQFYFPLNFLFMVFMSGLVSLQVAFKLGSLAGILLLPVTAYGFLRLVRVPFPGPGIGAALTLPVLFNSSHSMWGGNILSSFAGEISYALSMALSLLLLGSLYRGIRANSGVVRNALLVFLVGFSHGYTLLFSEAMSAYLLITPRGFIGRCFYLGRVYALAFCLLAFWIVPLLVFTRYTTPYDLVWTIHSWQEIFPPLLLPSLMIGAVGTLGLLVAGTGKYRAAGREFLPLVGYLWFGLAMAVVFFVAAPRIGVVDIRYVPYGHLLGSLLAAVSLGWLGWSLRKWKVDWVLLPVAAAAAMFWVAASPGPVASWAKWNYEGFEAKNTWPVFERINQALTGDFNDPRVVFEHSEAHNAFGSSRAFESLPLFAGRATLEGLYMQASISAPFVFYIQSEVSQQKSGPFPQYSYARMDFERARAHLELFNVRDLIIRSDAAKNAIRGTAGYRLRETIGDYELWELTTVSGAYVEALPFEPVVFPTGDWKQESHRWFRTPESLASHLVFVDEAVAAPPAPFRALARSLDEIPRVPIEGAPCSVESRVSDQQIEIDTDCIGRPLLVKMSYHPNWHVDGAEKIWLVSPSFMLIYPQAERVRLHYGPGPWDYLGRTLTLGALLVLLLNIPLPGGPGRTPWRLIVARTRLSAVRPPRFGFDPSPRARRNIMAATVLTLAVAIGCGSWVVYHTNPSRMFNHAIVLKDQGRYAQAREGFRVASHELGSSDRAQAAAYYVAITYYLEQSDTEAIDAFEDLIRRFPLSGRVPEAEYHIGLCLLRSGQKERGVEALQALRERFPDTQWAGYAAERLREHSPAPPDPGPMTGDNVDRHMGVAIDHFNHDRLVSARAILSEIAERFPDYSGAPQALAALALTWYKQGDCQGTERNYRALIERYPDSPLVAEAWYHLGICAERSSDTAAAQKFFSRVVSDYPDTAYARQARERIRE